MKECCPLATSKHMAAWFFLEMLIGTAMSAAILPRVPPLWRNIMKWEEIVQLWQKYYLNGIEASITARLAVFRRKKCLKWSSILF